MADRFIDVSESQIFITRAVRHWVEVSARVLFLAFFLVHVVLKYAGLNRMRLRPGYMSFELSNMTPALARVVVLKSWFWMTEHHKVGIFVKEQKFAFGNSQFTRQHNISLIVTDKYRRPGEELTKLFTSLISHQLGGRRVDFKFDWEKKWERCVGTNDSNFHGQRRLSLEQQLYYLIVRVFWSKRRTQFLLLVLLWGFVLKSGSDLTHLWWIGLHPVSI